MKTIILTDTHTEDQSIAVNISICRQLITACKKHNINTVFHGGDLITSRTGQTIKSLIALNTMFHMLTEAKIKMIAIPGNHDKTNLYEKESILDVFRRDGIFEVVDTYKYFDVSDSLRVHMIPYFKEGKDSPYLEQIEKVQIKTGVKNHLITHIAINGNFNGQFNIDRGFNPAIFYQFDKVFVGHFHNRYQLSSNILYMGSAYQANYGEDERKGFVLLHEDGKHEFINTQYKRYYNIEIDIDELVTHKEVQLHILSLIDSFSALAISDNVRFTFIGDSQNFVHINKTLISKYNIDVQTTSKSGVVEEINSLSLQSLSIKENQLIESFNVFCIRNKVDKKQRTLAASYL